MYAIRVYNAVPWSCPFVLVAFAPSASLLELGCSHCHATEA
jgi:hypothetical protein